MSHRSWMYDKKYPDGRIVKACFKDGVEEFITYTMSQDIVKREGGIRCLCVKCMCGSIESPENVIYHLEKFGFMNDFYVWIHYGEQVPTNINTEFDVNIDASSSGAQGECVNFGQMQEMVGDALGVNMSYEGGNEEEIIPNDKALKIYAMMEEVDKPLFEGASNSKLSMCVRLLAAKSNWNVPKDCLEFFSKMMLDAPPVKDNLQKRCMLFYDNEFGTNDGALEECKFCNAPRYQVRNSDVDRKQKRVSVKSMFYLPIILRLQRLFASMKNASQVTWHYYNKTNSNVMRHPCDGLAWKHFDAMHPDFAEDPRNVRLGLFYDGFTPYIQASATPYSCWPVIVTPFNLPPNTCMTKPYMFLSCIIPGPSNPTYGIDVYLQPLIDDLKRLWIGELTYDIARKENFTMRATLMWTINDFPTYGMLSGWSTHGKLACPHCMNHTKSFTFKKGGKALWFDCHRMFLPANHQFRRKKNLFKKDTIETDGPPPKITSYDVFDKVSGLCKFLDVGKRIRYDRYGESHNWTKRSIFWDLPYWKDNLLRHNLDVMHIEKNFCDNILHTVMDVPGKTKDNEKARCDLSLYCKRPEMELKLLLNGKYLKPKAVYSLTSDEAKSVCQWLKELRMADGYSSNLARCADVNTGRLWGMKSHDSHVLMERLLPIAFCSLPNHLLNTLTETKPRGQIEREVTYQDDEMSHVPNVIEVDPITNLVYEDVDGPQIAVDLFCILSFVQIKEKGRNTDIPDIHKETHIKKSMGAYVDQRFETTQRLYDEHVAKFLEKHPEYSNHDDIPGTMRRHIWQEELQARREEINKLVQQDQERQQMMQQEIRRAMEEQTREMEKQRRELSTLREMLASSRNAPIGETDPHEDSTNSNNEVTNAN
ncbi:hypothetical protein TSUD_243840 [Trifolium subterraneum]|uniref:Transposase-associated domain-containing protein n=1 Tax=Trifolium subterraneum TaxID=3900 RepID=A0A2Z6PMF2_TRISU|nr:hypothetical protein TSUD_243840 [Trifolium subterraneum]